jgi:hypothetical protein
MHVIKILDRFFSCLILIVIVLELEQLVLY